MRHHYDSGSSGNIFASSHWGLVTHTCTSKTCYHCFRKWMSQFGTSHWLNECWNIVTKTPRNIFQWDSIVSIQDIHFFKYIVCRWRAFCISLNVLIASWYLDTKHISCYPTNNWYSILAHVSNLSKKHHTPALLQGVPIIAANMSYFIKCWSTTLSGYMFFSVCDTKANVMVFKRA